MRKDTHTLARSRAPHTACLRLFHAESDRAPGLPMTPASGREATNEQEAVMKRLIAVLTIGLSVAGAGAVRAQETTPGPGKLEVTLVPGGGTFFTSSASEPAFGSYNLGAALTYNVNRIVGFEGDVGGSLGISQDLQFAGFTANQKGPNQVIYSGNRRHLGADPFVARAVRGRRHRRPDEPPAGEPRHRQQRDVPDR